MKDVCKECVESGVSKICGTSGGYVCQHYTEKRRIEEASKIEKAIQVIKDLNFRLTKDGVTKQANDMAIIALEKQLPRKVKVADVGYKMYGCPNCDYTTPIWSLGGKTDNCPNCGQKLDWGDNDEK